MIVISILSTVFCRQMVEKIELLTPSIASSVLFATRTPDNIGLTVMTSFPLQFSRLSRISIPQSASPARVSPPLETATALPPQRRTDRPHQRRSNSSAMNAADPRCPETRPCPRPSSGGRRPVRVPAGTMDDMDGSLGNVGAQCCYAVHLNAQANSHCERLIGSLRRDCLDFLIPINERHLRGILKDWKTPYCQARPHASLGPGLPELEEGLPVPLQKQRHQIPQGYRVSAKPILGGLHHEYRLEKIAA
jgi:Integrase core domain